MTEIIRDILILSFRKLKELQPDLLESTSETTMTEWNFGHHYANILCQYFDGYDCELDCIKRSMDRNRPDIIFHKRKTSEHNLFVLELKISEKISSSDSKKIKEKWMDGSLNYKYGCCISVSRDWFLKGEIFYNKKHKETFTSDNYGKKERIISFFKIDDA